MNRLSKEDFVKVIDDIKKVIDYEEAFNNVLRNYGDGYLLPPDCIDSTIKLLEKFFGDEENQWIAYYIWELDFGKEYEDEMIKDVNDENIPLATVDDLYDILMENLNGVEN